MDHTTLAEALKAVGEPTRLKIVAVLMWAEEVCVCDMVNFLALPQPTVSRHLRILRSTGWVIGTRKGQWMRYSLSPNPPPELQSLREALGRIFAGEQYEPIRNTFLQYQRLKEELGCPHPSLPTWDG